MKLMPFEDVRTYAFLCNACRQLWVVFVQKTIPHPERTKCPFCGTQVGPITH
jgi:hypothetical protein